MRNLVKILSICCFMTILSSLAFANVPIVSIDILEVNYVDDAGRQLDYTFDDGSLIDIDRILFPLSAITSHAEGEEYTDFLWESTIHQTGSLDLRNDLGLSRFSVPYWQSNGDPDQDLDSEDFVSLGAFDASWTFPMNWSFSAKVTNFQHHIDGEHPADRYFAWQVGVGAHEAQADCAINAEWYTGIHEGVFYDDTLVIRGEISNEVTDEDWESEPIVITGLNPLTDQIECKVQIVNGTMFSAYYRINDAAEWTTICENIERPYPIPGFPQMFPTVKLANGVQEIEEPNDEEPNDVPAVNSGMEIKEVRIKNHDCKKHKDHGDVKVKGYFDPNQPIDLEIDDVIYTLEDPNGYAMQFFIPAGSFKKEGKKHDDKYRFHSHKKDESHINAKFDFKKGSFELMVKEFDAAGTITAGDITVTLHAGTNLAQQTVTLEQKGKGRGRAQHLEYKSKPKHNHIHMHMTKIKPAPKTKPVPKTKPQPKAGPKAEPMHHPKPKPKK